MRFAIIAVALAGLSTPALAQTTAGPMPAPTSSVETAWTKTQQPAATIVTRSLACTRDGRPVYGAASIPASSGVPLVSPEYCAHQQELQLRTSTCQAAGADARASSAIGNRVYRCGN